jgi:PTS system mannose-specific IIA component
MIGIVLVGHCHLAEELHTVIKSIVGTVENVCSVNFVPDEPPEESIKKVAGAIRKVDKGDGVLMLTDMFGGTPSNLSLSFLEEGRVEVLTGVNLPMLIRLITLRANGKKLSDMAQELKLYGQKNICIASEILKTQKLADQAAT